MDDRRLGYIEKILFKNLIKVLGFTAGTYLVRNSAIRARSRFCWGRVHPSSSMSCVVCSWVFRLSPFQSSSSPQQQQRSPSLLLAAANKTKPSSSSSLLIYSLSSTVCTFQRLRLLLTSVERRAGSMCAFLPVASLLHAADKHPEKSQRIEEEFGRPLRYRKPLFHVQEKNPVLLWRVIDSSVHEFGLGFTSLLVDSWNFVVVVATDLLRSSQRRHVGHGVLSLLLALALTSKNAPPSSMETFENVPQTLSGTLFFLSFCYCVSVFSRNSGASVSPD